MIAPTQAFMRLWNPAAEQDVLRMLAEEQKQALLEETQVNQRAFTNNTP
jgi:hypothetical protein